MTTTKTTEISKQLIKEFPSFNVIANNPKYHIDDFVHPFQSYAFRNSNQWELLAFACQNILTKVTGRPFYSSYYYDDKGGHAFVYDAGDGEYKVDIDTFKALCLVVYFSWTELPINRKKAQLILEWKEDSDIWHILD